jgi:hypothetical protein
MLAQEIRRGEERDVSKEELFVCRFKKMGNRKPVSTAP